MLEGACRQHAGSQTECACRSGPDACCWDLQGLIDSSQGVFGVNAHAAEAPPEPKVDIKQEVKPAVGPVSKWTLVDYDDEAAAAPFPEAK